MSAIISGYVTTEKLEEILKVVKQKNAKGFAFTVSVNDESNQYGQNVNFSAQQTKEDREAKKKKWFFGNGNIVWTDGKITKSVKNNNQNNNDNGHSDDLPF